MQMRAVPKITRLSRRSATVAGLMCVVAASAIGAAPASAGSVESQLYFTNPAYQEFGARHSYTYVHAIAYAYDQPSGTIDYSRYLCVRKRYDSGGYAPSACGYGAASRGDYSASKLGFPQAAMPNASDSSPHDAYADANY